ncbi:hypothetical protein K0A97_02360 [Patescibacteria group bacterium]|nr:hypothetical protein [Patescibacteria group bacterium]
MKLRKCPSCKTYSLKETCNKCKGKTSIAHYKFIKIKDSLEKSE